MLEDIQRKKKLVIAVMLRYEYSYTKKALWLLLSQCKILEISQHSGKIPPLEDILALLRDKEEEMETPETNENTADTASGILAIKD